MLRRKVIVAGAILALATSLMEVPTASAQVASVTVKSVDDLLADFKYLAPLAGQAERVKQVEAFLKEKTGGIRLEGVDRKRPFGACVLVPEKLPDLASLGNPVVFFVPVADEKRLLSLLEQMKWKPRPAEGGRHQLSVPDGPGLFLRFAHRYAFVATGPALLRGELPDPAKLLSPEDQQATFIFQFHTDRLPKGFEQLLNEAMEPLVQFLQEQAKEFFRAISMDEPQLQEIKGSVETWIDVGVRIFLQVIPKNLIEQIRMVSLRLDVDQRQHLLVMDLVVFPGPGKGLADFCQYAGTARSQFSYLTRQADLGVTVHFPVPESIRKLGTSQGIIPRELHGMLPPKYRASLLKLIQVLAPTGSIDGLDIGLAGNESKGKDDYLIVGMKVRNGRKLDHLLRDEYKNLSAAEKSEISLPSILWNHDRHGSAHIHRFNFGGENGDGVLAIRDDVVFLAGGEDGRKRIKQALDGFGKATAPPSPLFQLDATSGLFRSEEKFAKAIEKTVPAADQDRIRARLSLQGGQDLRLRLEMSPFLLQWGPILWEKEEKKPSPDGKP